MHVGTSPLWEAGLPASNKQLWVLRYGSNGMNIEVVDSRSYFAPKPLSNKLQSKSDIAVNAFDSTSGTLENSTDTQTVSDVDLDQYMRSFLEAVELFFTPKYAVPAFVANEEAFDTCIQAKEDLVGELIKNVSNLISGENYGQNENTPPEDMKAGCGKTQTRMPH